MVGSLFEKSLNGLPLIETSHCVHFVKLLFLGKHEYYLLMFWYFFVFIYFSCLFSLSVWLRLYYCINVSFWEILFTICKVFTVFIMVRYMKECSLRHSILSSILQRGNLGTLNRKQTTREWRFCLFEGLSQRS